jgi:PTH1 family peptidyl-tRNA hydrolase
VILVIGLGNPGVKYQLTRHNAGFLLVDRLADEFGIALTQGKFGAIYGKGQIFGKDLLLIKPQTFMNLSGRSVSQWVGFYKIAESDIIVIHDDIDQEAGAIKAKVGGGHGGHNGIRSIIAETGMSGFHRIKIGVGRSSNSGVTDWVLGNFSADELENLGSDVYEQVKVRLGNIFLQKSV